jgi:nucleoside-diphosphate-sugar epimerase
VVVTGAAGFFGLAIVRALTSTGTEVLAVDRTHPDGFSPRRGTVADRVRYVARDLTREPLDDLIRESDAVVHAAALTPLAEAGGVLDDVLAVNLVPLTGILQAMQASPACRRLIFISSAGVYDQTSGPILVEEDATGGTSLYGAAKLAAELVISRYAELASLEHCAVRPTSLFGPGEIARPSRPRVTSFKQLVDAARGNQRVRIEQPEARTDWLHVDDAADALVLLLGLARLPGRAFSLSSSTPRPFKEVVAAVASASSLQLDPASEVVVSGGADRGARIVNAQLRAAIEWEPARAFEDACRTMLNESELVGA